jgi:hypothetical protein
MPIRRLGEARNVERHVDDDARLDLRHARNLRHPLAETHRRARQPREHIGEPVAVVIGLLREPERVERAQVHDEHGDAGGDDQTDRRRLPFQVPQITEQLSV